MWITGEAVDNSASFVFVVLLPLIPKIPVDRLAEGAILVIVGIVAAPVDEMVRVPRTCSP